MTHTFPSMTAAPSPKNPDIEATELSSLLDGWAARLAAEGYKPATVGEYSRNASAVLATANEVARRHFDARSLPQIAEHLGNIEARLLAEGLDADSVYLYITAFRSFARFLHDTGIRCDGILIAKRSPRGRSESDTIDAVLAVDDGSEEGADWTVLRDRQIARLVADDAVSLAEVLALTGRDFDSSTQTVFAGKSRRAVDIGLLRTAKLQRYVAACPFDILPDGPLFVGQTGAAIHVRTAQLTLQCLGERLGVPERISARKLRSGSILRKRLEGKPDKTIIAETGLTSTQHFARRFLSQPIDPRRVEHAKEEVRRNLSPDLILSNSSASRPPLFDATPSQEPLSPSRSYRSGDAPPVPMKRLFNDEHLDEYITQNCPHPTYVGHLRRFRDYLLSNGLTADHATARDIERFYVLRAQDCTGNTVAITHTAIHEFYVHAFRGGLVSRVPTLDVEAPTQEKKPPIAASREVVKLWIEKVEEFIAQCREPNLNALRIAALIALCGLEGVKIGHARRLTPLDIREPGPEHPWAALGGHAVGCLARIARAAPASKYFFGGRDPQHPVSAQHARKWLHAWALKLELPPITFEMLTQAYKREFLGVEPDIYMLAATTSERGRSGYDFEELSEPLRDGTSRSTQLALALYVPPGGWSL